MENKKKVIVVKESESESESEEIINTNIKCDICLSWSDKVLDCSECKFSICCGCMNSWINKCNNFNCPLCKKNKSFTVNYHEYHLIKSEKDILNEELEELINSFSGNIVISSVIQSILSMSDVDPFREDLTYSPDGFLDMYNNSSEEIKNKWIYQPIEMGIDESNEIVGYRVFKIKE